MEKTKPIRHLLRKLSSDRANWESSWQDIADHIIPRLNRFNTQSSPGVQKQQYIFDSSPTHSLTLCISGLASRLSNPATKWFGLTTSDPRTNRLSQVQKWLQSTQDQMLNVLNQSSFSTDSYDVYQYLILFGTAALYIGWDDDRGVYFKHIPLDELYIRESSSGSVDSVIRKYDLSIRNVIAEFGKDNVSRDTQEKAQQNDEDTMTILHAVFPRTDKILGSWKGNLPYVSVYMEERSGHVLREGGYNEFPYAVPRMFVSPGEYWGRGLGWQALPDIKTLYIMVKTLLESAEKTVRPPLAVPSDLMEGKLSMKSNAINFVRSNAGRIEPMYMSPSMPFTEQLIDKKRLQIARIFLNDQLQMVGDTTMTATEVMHRAEEKMTLLAPVLGRVQDEFLGPVIERTYKIMSREGLLEPMPDIIADKGWKIDYLSPIARAQRLSEVNAIQRMLELSSPLLAADPSTFELFKPDEMIRTISDILGVPAEVLRTNVEMRNIKDQQTQSAQMMQQAQLMQAATNQSKIASEAELNRSRAQNARI